ncbi:MAG: DNA-directed DNA polymerase [Candidatus Micrarchaeia archaeon]|jgi:DNA polymerase I
MELEGIILDIDYITIGKRGIIRFALKSAEKVYELIDLSFYPYFYLVPFNKSLSREAILGFGVDEEAKVTNVEECTLYLFGKEVKAFKIFVNSPRDIPALSEALMEFGERFEYDIVFWKRYLIDKGISPMQGAKVKAHEENGRLVVDEIESSNIDSIKLSHISFDIETYNPKGAPRPEKDPVIMISYTDGKDKRVLTTKKIEKDFVLLFDNEKALIQGFTNIIKELDPDIIAGYNSSNFDIPYLLSRSKVLKADFSIGRFEGEVKKEHHGLIEAVHIPGRVNIDIYNVAKFVSVVGAAEKLIKVNNFKLDEIYSAVTGKKKKMVERRDIWKMWDNGELSELVEYSLGDSLVLDELYDFFLPLEVEVSKVSGLTMGEVAISTTGQLVEWLLMREAHKNNQIIPNKPSEEEIERRLANPVEGAYVKTPEAGIYKNIAVLDFRGLYPSIIVAHNIDPSTICNDCTDYYESPIGVKFRKEPMGIAPKILKFLIEERIEVKKAYKKDPDNKALGARNMALKILANSFYGYLGYARSRWYSRECAGSVTAYGRQYIMMVINEAEKSGFKSLYTDTDSVFLLLEDKTKEDVFEFIKKINSMLPKGMELELEDFYVSGVFVGKRTGEQGAKKKYALLAENGRIKIRGFELVRRDWADIARETQKKVLESILKEGSKEKAIEIVKNVIDRLRKGDVSIKELVIHTQLRKSIRSYDVTSPELAAAKKAIERGQKKVEEVEGTTVGYVITKHGNSISEKAELEEFAKDYDPEYYIDHQVIPATLKILKELGYNADELKGRGMQKKLGG